MLFRVLLVAAAVALVPTPVAAQWVPAFSLDASMGLAMGHGGDFHTRGGATVDLLAAAPLREAAPGTLLGALALGVEGPMVTSEVCVIAPDGGCLDDFPLFLTASALLGLETRGPRTTLRYFVGPGLFLHQAGGAAGLQTRVDLAMPRAPFGFVFGIRGSVLPNVGGEVLTSTAASVGLRVRSF